MNNFPGPDQSRRMFKYTAKTAFTNNVRNVEGGKIPQHSTLSQNPKGKHVK